MKDEVCNVGVSKRLGKVRNDCVYASLIGSPLELCGLASPWQDARAQVVHGTIYI